MNKNTTTQVGKSIFKMILIFNILALSFLFTQKSSAQNVNTGSDGNLYKDFKTEFIWDAKVKIANMINVGESKRGRCRKNDFCWKNRRIRSG